jgi:hypothetical protein
MAPPWPRFATTRLAREAFPPVGLFRHIASTRLQGRDRRERVVGFIAVSRMGLFRRFAEP